MKNVVLFVFLMGMLLQACAPAAPVTTPTPVPSGTPAATAVPPTDAPPSAEPTAPGILPPPVSGPSEGVVQMSIEYLHEKFSLDADTVKVNEVTSMTWPDAGLGCPKKGVLYIQALTPGFQILLEADGHVFTFHTNESSIVVLCSVEPPDEIYQAP